MVGNWVEPNNAWTPNQVFGSADANIVADDILWLGSDKIARVSYAANVTIASSSFTYLHSTNLSITVVVEKGNPVFLSFIAPEMYTEGSSLEFFDFEVNGVRAGHASEGLFSLVSSQTTGHLAIINYPIFGLTPGSYVIKPMAKSDAASPMTFYGDNAPLRLWGYEAI